MQSRFVVIAKINMSRSSYSTAKSAGRWLWRILSIGLMVLGLSGVPDDLANWQVWIDTVVNNHHVNQLAEKAVELADFANQWWVRGLFLGAGLVIIAWGWKPFWNVRHKIKFRLKKMIAEKIWIDEESAKTLIRQSDWLNARRPAKSVSVLDLASYTQFTRVVRDPEAIQLAGFIKLVLKKFSENYPDSYRKNENGLKQFDEVELVAYLDRSLEGDAKKKYGSIPD